MHDFESDEYIIENQASLCEGVLSVRDDRLQERLQTGGNNLGDQLVDHATKADWTISEICSSLCFFSMSATKVWFRLGGVGWPFSQHCHGDVVSNGFLELLEENKVHAISVWCLLGMHLFQGSINLVSSIRAAK